jgi:hypothetical protein
VQISSTIDRSGSFSTAPANAAGQQAGSSLCSSGALSLFASDAPNAFPLDAKAYRACENTKSKLLIGNTFLWSVSRHSLRGITPRETLVIRRNPRLPYNRLSP